MPVEERRELVLRAATRAFARGGYTGTSTDAVAREAGVSQPYVVRIFGTKLDLFLEVFARSADRIQAAFGSVLAEGPFDPESEEDWDRLALAYAELLEDHDLLMVLMHGFAAGGADPEIAACGRAGMGRIYATIASTGCTPERARDFIAKGMLLNVMVSIGAPSHPDDAADLDPLTACAFGDLLPSLTS